MVKKYKFSLTLVSTPAQTQILTSLLGTLKEVMSLELKVFQVEPTQMSYQSDQQESFLSHTACINFQEIKRMMMTSS
jgi:hypothetical protein